MSASKKALTVYNIPAGTPFGDALALGLLEQAAQNGHALTDYRVLLPTRRACRNLREIFLRLSEGKPLLLPRLQPIGDVEEDELVLELAGKENAAQILELPPPISPLRRQILLARTIAQLPGYARGTDQDFALAGALGRLMDQIYTEGLDFKNLPGLVKEETLATHWQVTVKFLEILSERWPEILAEHHAIDAADRRNRLINTLAQHWENNPPSGPVIAAGSTGSIPATGNLLRVIAGLPQGAIVLPGLDTNMDKESWLALDDTHPQATLKYLLEERIGIKRSAVGLWPYRPARSEQSNEPAALEDKKQKARCRLAGEAMRPAATAHKWRELKLNDDQKHTLEESLKQVMRFDCSTAQEEAKLIAVMMRQTLETPGRVAALITPDRALARRVTMVCQRWGITVDDSGGLPLSDTPLGSYLRLIMQAATNNIRPGALAALLKHRYCRFQHNREKLASLIDALEIDILRGPATNSGFKALYKKAEDEKADTALLEQLDSILSPLLALAANSSSFKEILDAHIMAAEQIATREDGERTLWQGEEGEAAALFLSNLREQAGLIPAVNGESYLAIFEQLMRTINVRPLYGTHPRILILGQLEARLIKADLVILGGLNEGTWPPDPGNDPWMSRPMRKEFALPSPERSVGLSAHDFVQGFCSPHIVLTRAQRVDGTPTIPARWLQRFDTVLEALKLNHNIYGHGFYLQQARILDRPAGESAPVRRPEPRPPVNKRPDSLYVTHIEKWMRDPYSIYARHILNLKRLDDLEEQADAAQRGTMMHDVLDKFVQEHPEELPADAYERLITLGRNMLAEKLEEPRLWGFWWPRFERLADWFVNHERQWRQKAKPVLTEAKGSAELDIDGEPFKISAKVDRIDKMDGGYAVIDYKTGTAPSNKDIENGYSPQLPLEGVIITEGGFESLEPDDVLYMGFWSMTGAARPGDEKPVKTDIEQARQGLIRLIRTFRDKETPYYSLPRPEKAPPAAWQDYAHLARVQEWAALDDSEEAA